MICVVEVAIAGVVEMHHLRATVTLCEKMRRARFYFTLALKAVELCFERVY